MSHLTRTLKRSVALRCPACGHGRLYAHGLRLYETCQYCQVRFERAAGESLGAVYLTSATTMLLIFGGFWLLDTVLDVDATPFLVVWILGVMSGNIIIYRLARSLWIGIAYLTGGVYADADDEREYSAPQAARTTYKRDPPPL